MKIYALTTLGRRLARSTNNPDTPEWRIVHHLDQIGYQTSDQISEGTGLSPEQTAAGISRLRRGGVIGEAAPVRS